VVYDVLDHSYTIAIRTQNADISSFMQGNFNAMRDVARPLEK
jgi:hypothetical protein